MSSGGIVDVGTGIAATIGRYFSVVSVVPSSLYLIFAYLLIASGSWHHPPNWSHAFQSLEHLGVGGIALLALFSVALGVIVHPIQFAIVQFFEGYWGVSPPAQAIRYQRILYYRKVCRDLRGSQNTAIDELKGAEDTRRVQLNSRIDEASRIRKNYFPRALDNVMPTRLGNVLRRAESQAGTQYGMKALQVVPLLLLIAPTNHVDYVNDQRSQLDLAVRMTFMSVVATATAILFLWPYGFWLLVAVIPYALAYVSYRGSVVAAIHYGAALEALVNLDRFALYEQLHLRLPAATAIEREANKKLGNLLNYDDAENFWYDHPAPGAGD